MCPSGASCTVYPQTCFEQWAITIYVHIKIQVKRIESRGHHHFMLFILSAISSWKIVNLTLNNNHAHTQIKKWICIYHTCMLNHFHEKEMTCQDNLKIVFGIVLNISFFKGFIFCGIPQNYRLLIISIYTIIKQSVNYLNKYLSF